MSAQRDGVELTHLDQPLFDGADATKQDLVDYLDAVRDRILPVLRDRPLSVMRIRPGQEPFMQKNLPKYAPEWVPTARVWADASRRTITYPLANDWRTLLWFANQRAVEYHPALAAVSQSGGQDRPTHLIMDIDPPEGAGFGPVAAAAHLVRRALEELGLAGAVKTSGSKGVHIFVPLDGQAGTFEVAAVTRAIGARAERLDPTLATTAFIREDRAGKVFIDSTRAGGATVAAAYSPRIRPGVTVSCPVPWDDLNQVTPQDFTLRTVPSLLGDRDPWAELMPPPQHLDPHLIEEGHAIPIARVQAMHEGKRRARARREG
ncbi:MAG TPA: ATP-dependent DNA ligase [Streptosporangiaceae bacterium]|jgi:DNA ligase D-like protein (predicted polymerase)|nr:ATP-dependent DNA ligase [Streptosporangiaceae bacterium]